jgi:outer membrane protein
LYCRWRRVLPLRPVAVLTLLGAAGSCVHNPPHVDGKPVAPRAPNQFWEAPRKAVTPDSVPHYAVPPDIATRVNRLTLPDVVDIALSNNPLTRESYAQARAAGATIGAAYGRYLPQLTASGFAEREGSTSTGTSATTTGGALGAGGGKWKTLEQGTGSVSWLLFDFGEFSEFSFAKQAAFAASFNHNFVVQTAVLTVEQAYFNYNAAKAVRDADAETVREDSTNLAAAQARHVAGVAVISDVLQAQTTLAQADLTLETDEGAVQTTRGTLAVSMGFPANVPYDIAPEPPDIPVSEVSESVDTLVQQAVRSRPDLAAYRAQARQAQANVGIVRGQGLPSITLGGNGSRTNFAPTGSCNPRCSPSLDGNTYAAQLGISIPVFQGFTNSYNILQAKELAKASAANAEYQRDLVVYQVFASYYNLRTATVRVKSSDDLLASAQASYDVSIGKYRQGVGSILDLLTAQAALASARSQQATARWTWYSNLAQLSHDAGIIGIHGESHLQLGPDSTGSQSPPR